MDLRRTAGRSGLALALGFASIWLLTSCNTNNSSQVESQFPDSNNKQNSDDCGAKFFKDQAIITWKNGTQTLAKIEDVEDFKKTYLSANISDIDWVEYNREVKLERTVSSQLQIYGTSTDSRVAIDSTSGVAIPETEIKTWGVTSSGADSAWSAGQTGKGAIVAVIDQAIDVKHIQLVGQIAVNDGEIPDNGKDDDGNGLVDDYYGWNFADNVPQKGLDTADTSNTHGTHVAGIIAADSTKGMVRGVAQGSKILPASFIGGDSSGTVFVAIKAMEYSIARGATIINASWGGSSCSASLKAFMESVDPNKVLFVTAAGNAGLNMDDPTTREYPAAFVLPNQLTVIAQTHYVGTDGTLKFDAMASFSNYGRKYTHLAAPGADIESTIPGGVAYKSGTSMATPFISGAAAILVGAYPSAPMATIRKALLKSVDSASVPTQSQGTLNIPAALDWMSRNQ